MIKKLIVLVSLVICILLSSCSSQNVVTSNNATEQPKLQTTQSNMQISNTQVADISQDDALKRVQKIVGSLPKGYFLHYDHTQKVNYVFQLYEGVIDNAQTGDGHSVTYEWYYVDKSNGQVYKMDMSSGNLDKVEENETGKEQTSYKQYTNARFGFSIEYPSTFIIKLLPDNNDGIVLASPDGNTELTVSGSNNVLNETALSRYNNLLKEHSNTSYKKQESNWLIVSWIEGDKIAYQKTVVGSDSINTFLIKYPISQKDNFNSIVSHLNLSFKTPAIDDVN